MKSEVVSEEVEVRVYCTQLCQPRIGGVAESGDPLSIGSSPIPPYVPLHFISREPERRQGDPLVPIHFAST